MTKERQEDVETVRLVLETPAGKRLFKLLHRICGYELSDRVVRNDGQIDLVATALNAERRGVYVFLRSLAPVDMLKMVEYDNEEEGE